MEVEELMLGDWVHYKMDLGKDGIYEKDIRINNIYGNEVNCELRGYEIISGKRSSNLHPIPLTTEILEKNGFQAIYNVSSSANKNMWWLEQLCLCEHHDKKKFPYFWISIGSDVDIKYVHELQHAMRLCCIEQKIVL